VCLRNDSIPLKAHHGLTSAEDFDQGPGSTRDHWAGASGLGHSATGHGVYWLYYRARGSAVIVAS